MGGLAALSFAVLRPEVFDNYILASPATMYDNHFILNTLEDKGKISYQSMFITAALNDANGYKENVDWMYEFLEKTQTEAQKLETKIYPNETHGTTGIKSLIDGLEFIGGGSMGN